MSAIPHVRNGLYGGFDHKKALVSMAQEAGVLEALSQEAAFSVDTTDIANRVAGLALYNQVNMNNNILGVLPEIDRTGEENVDVDVDEPAATYRAIFDPPSTSGVAGGGSIPTAVTWETRKVEARIKISAMAIESDFIHDIESRLGHDTVGFEQLVEVADDYMTRSVDRDGLARPVSSGGDQYGVDDLIVMLDRVIASEDEETNADDPSGAGLTDGDLDIYDIDRSATGADAANEANWADATVDHNGGTPRQLTGDLVNTFLDNVVTGSSAEYENLVLVTGRNTARVLSDLRESQFVADAFTEPGREEVNDADSRYGQNITTRISHWDGIPVVVNEAVPSDNLERLFALDMSPTQVPGTNETRPKIGIENYRTPDVWRAGPDQPANPLTTGEIKSEAAFAMYHELVCRDFGAQGKLRDIEV